MGAKFGDGGVESRDVGWMGMSYWRMNGFLKLGVLVSRNEIERSRCILSVVHRVSLLVS